MRAARRAHVWVAPGKRRFDRARGALRDSDAENDGTLVRLQTPEVVGRAVGIAVVRRGRRRTRRRKSRSGAGANPGNRIGPDRLPSRTVDDESTLRGRGPTFGFEV